MNDVILWSVWYGVLVILPPVMTRLFIKHAMERATARQRRRSSIHRK